MACDACRERSIRLLPAFVLRARRRIRKLERERGALHALLDVVPFGVILCDTSLNVIRANRWAAALLRERDGLVLRDGRLHATRAKQTAHLCGLVAAAEQAATGGGGFGGPASLARPSGRPPLEILAARLAPEADSPGPGRRFALFVSDPDRTPTPCPERLGPLHGLTRTEARVAARLVEGDSTRRIAGSLGIQQNTVRWHLKQIYAKTGVRSQLELQRKLLGSVWAWAAGRRHPPPRASSSAQRAVPAASAAAAAPIFRCSTPPKTE